jgi:anti-anti-sigma factor
MQLSSALGGRPLVFFMLPSYCLHLACLKFLLAKFGLPGQRRKREDLPERNSKTITPPVIEPSTRVRNSVYPDYGKEKGSDMLLQPGWQSLEVKIKGDATEMTIPHKVFGEPNPEAFGKMVSRLADQSGRHKVQLDFARVRCLSASGLGALVMLHKRLRAAGGQLTFCNVSPQVHDIFQITGLMKLLHIIPKAGG